MKLPVSAGIWGLVLSQAPLLWEAATKVAEHLRNRPARSAEEIAAIPPEQMTLPELGAEVGRLRQRIGALDDAQREQIELIRRVVEQNRDLALALRGLSLRFRIVAVAALAFFLLDAWLVWRLWRP